MARLPLGPAAAVGEMARSGAAHVANASQNQLARDEAVREAIATVDPVQALEYELRRQQEKNAGRLKVIAAATVGVLALGGGGVWVFDHETNRGVNAVNRTLQNLTGTINAMAPKEVIGLRDIQTTFDHVLIPQDIPVGGVEGESTVALAKHTVMLGHSLPKTKVSAEATVSGTVESFIPRSAVQVKAIEVDNPDGTKDYAPEIVVDQRMVADAEPVIVDEQVTGSTNDQEIVTKIGDLPKKSVAGVNIDTSIKYAKGDLINEAAPMLAEIAAAGIGYNFQQYFLTSAEYLKDIDPTGARILLNAANKPVRVIFEYTPEHLEGTSGQAPVPVIAKPTDIHFKKAYVPTKEEFAKAQHMNPKFVTFAPSAHATLTQEAAKQLSDLSTPGLNPYFVYAPEQTSNVTTDSSSILGVHSGA